MRNRLILILISAGLINGYTFAEIESDTLNPILVDSIDVEVDSSDEHDTLVESRVLSADEMEELEEQREDSLQEVAERHEDSLEQIEDTIDASELTSKFEKYREAFSARISKSRAQGYGGGVVVQPMMLGLKTEPVYDLARKDRVLRIYDFPDLAQGYKPVLVAGGLVYGGVGKGVRVGFGGWGGDFYYASEKQSSDSILVLQVHSGFGGLFVEKVFLRKNLNLFIGGMLGGGQLTVTPKWDIGAFESVFRINKEEEKKAEAAFAGLELHTGFTVTLLPWLHVGTDINGLFLISVNGFGETGNSFMTANPGVRLRLVFGNLG